MARETRYESEDQKFLPVTVFHTGTDAPFIPQSCYANLDEEHAARCRAINSVSLSIFYELASAMGARDDAAGETADLVDQFVYALGYTRTGTIKI